MRTLPLPAASCLVALLAVTNAYAAASESVTASLLVTAQFGSRTSLTVSTQLLQFDVTGGGTETVAVVDFSARARTQRGGEVVLSVEPLRMLEGAGGAADVETSITFAGEGDGTLSGALQTRSPSVAGRWIGSGIRSGRLAFALRAATSGRYDVPVRFVLSTP